MDPVHERGSMDPVHESSPWTRSKVGVHGPLVHFLSSPAKIKEFSTTLYIGIYTCISNVLSDKWWNITPFSLVTSN